MECKVWIENGIETAWNRGFALTEIEDILRIIKSNLKLINDHMSSYLREIKTARIDAIHLTVELMDGFVFTMPLSFYPTLQLARDEERNAMEVNPYSLHWESLDCDLGIEGLLQGAKEHPKLAEKARQRFEQRRHAAA